MLFAIWPLPAFAQDDQADSSDEDQIQVPVPDQEGMDQATEEGSEEDTTSEEQTEETAPEEPSRPLGVGQDTITFGQFTFITSKDTANGKIISMVPPQSTIWEDFGILQIGEEFFLTGRSKFQERYVNGNIGFVAGLLLPMRIPGTQIYYSARASFHKSVADTETSMLTTATNEIRGGVPLLIKDFPLEYVPMIGIGFNNAVILRSFKNLGLVGFNTHYYWHYSLGLTARQPLIFKRRYSSLGLSICFERAFVFKEQTDQRLVLILLIGG
jgi:hypothetical protein